MAFTMKFYRSDISTVINLVWVGKPWCMDLFFVLPEDIQVEESPCTGRAGQLHAQGVPTHMGADGCTGGGRSFMVPLNPAMINPLTSPHINTKGCYVGWDGDLQGLRNGKRGGLLCLCAPSATDARGAGLALSDSWGGGLDTVKVAANWHLLAGAGPLARMNGIRNLKGGHTGLWH